MHRAKPIWTHITIQVSNIEQSIAFYERWCGMTIVRDRRITGGNTVWMGSYADSDKQRDLLLVLDPEPVTDRMRHFGFQLENLIDLDAMAVEAEQAGILAAPPTLLGGELGHYLMIRDPDGHDVEFTVGQPIRGLQ